MQFNKFLMTQDKMTADKLLEAGFKLLNYNNKVWLFINMPDLYFNMKQDLSQFEHIVETNILAF